MNDYYDVILEKAKDGDLNAQKELAYFYLGQQNRKESYVQFQAFEWFRKAASKEDPEAQYMVSFLYLNGIGRDANDNLAKQWYEKAVTQGLKIAPQNLKSIFEGEQVRYPEIFDNPDGDNGISFRDIAFKKDKDGNDIVEIKYKGEPKPDADDEKESNRKRKKKKKSTRKKTDDDMSKYSYDDWLYTDSSLTRHDPDLEQDPHQQLNRLVGLHGIKAQVEQVLQRMAFDSLREKKKLDTRKASNHFVFSGNPGTGKNDVARILGHVLHDIGVLETGHVIEVDRGDLAGAWIGHTALKTKAAIKAAKGGVLFIDEAYSLDNGSYWDFGGEAISTLMKAMEDDREDFVVVMAGYKDEMGYLLKSNPGLQSRFRHHLEFEDYSAQELADIFVLFAEEQGYRLHKDTKQAVLSLMKTALKAENPDLGNGRFVRNVFEKALEKMAVRVMRKEKQLKKDLQLIMFSDIPSLDEINGTPRQTGTGNVVPF